MRSEVKEDLTEAIGRVCELEVQVDWLIKAMRENSDHKIRSLAALLEPGKQLLFAVAAEITSDIYDATRELIYRPTLSVSIAHTDDSIELLDYLTTVSEKIQEILTELAELLNWDGLDLPMKPEMLYHTCGKLKGAYRQIDGTKTALAITIAGYPYERLTEDSPASDGNLIKEEHRGYV